MFFSFPMMSVASVTGSSVATQTSPELLPYADDSRSSPFSSSFSIRAILSSSSTSPPAAPVFSTFLLPQLMLAGDAGPPGYSPFPCHHCCSHGACAANWQTDSGSPIPFLLLDYLITFTSQSTSQSHDRGLQIV